MGRKVSVPILPAHKRARCSNPARFVTDSKRAFELGRGGMAPPVWLEANQGLMMRWKAGKKQRDMFVAAIEKAGGKPCLTEYEHSLRKVEEAEKAADDALYEKQMAALQAAFKAQGLNLTRHAIAQELARQKRG